ncbi:hypothetical protein [Acinetobacter baumannii]|uniref:hypothetical protein n=1 Tax=Acinetobacter baumannii TaxID=470 RepID=UPI00254FDE16|nr:hypothetical protein [Acinetobacter baumannii]MDK6142678.1 hypothetical protein [Acinetobacter baumannii]
MDKSWIFRTDKGTFGIARRQNDTIKYLTESKILTRNFSAQWDWNDWIRRVNDGQVTGNTTEVSAESIQFYFSFNGPVGEKVIELIELKYPGYFYPRIANERVNYNYISEEFYQDIRAFQNIQRSLSDLFNYIEPSQINLKVYGHKIRELLILACTEVEYLLLKVLVENAYTVKAFYTTKDYIKCRDLLKLDQFEVILTQYPLLKKFQPFNGWDDNSPTKSLAWYDAYNSVKHNRGDNIQEANLEHLLDSISALHILLQSQYGENIFDKWYSYTDDRSIFQTKIFPHWELERICAPLLEQAYQVKTSWLGARQFFIDNPGYL